MKIPDGKYCVDGAGVPLPSNATTQFSGEINDLVLHLCRDAEDLGPEEPTQQQFILNSILVPFAIVFILMTIVVYLLTLLEHNHYGWSILSYLVTLLALYVTIVIDNAHSRSFASKYPKICATIGESISVYSDKGKHNAETNHKIVFSGSNTFFLFIISVLGDMHQL